MYGFFYIEAVKAFILSVIGPKLKLLALILDNVKANFLNKPILF